MATTNNTIQQEKGFRGIMKSCISALVTQMEMNTSGEFTSIPLVLGSPGVGKSSFIKHELLNELRRVTGKRWGSVHHYIGTWPLEKMSGLPKKCDKDEKIAEWTMPQLFDVRASGIDIENEKDSYVLVILDDIHMLKEYMACYLYEIYSYKTSQGYKLHPNIVLMAAGNRFEDNSGYVKIPEAIINRYIIIPVEACLESWIRDYVQVHMGCSMDPCILAFLKTHPQHFSTSHNNNQPFATPRSWVSFANTTKRFQEVYQEVLPAERYANFLQIGNGLLGSVISTEYNTFYQSIYNHHCDDILSGTRPYLGLGNLPDLTGKLTFCVAMCLSFNTLMDESDVSVESLKKIFTDVVYRLLDELFKEKMDYMSNVILTQIHQKDAIARQGKLDVLSIVNSKNPKLVEAIYKLLMAR